MLVNHPWSHLHCTFFDLCIALCIMNGSCLREGGAKPGALGDNLREAVRNLTFSPSKGKHQCIYVIGV
jgi:hypothetical protein